ncbi:MAG: DUF1549 and DUF1553 domain-containing protein [Planctomycetota bacterium]|nr:DUF1549 and DUF1553 domain-containing protein [Planctomycetota bacterium]
MNRFLFTCLIASCVTATAGETFPPASVRFADSNASETPDFQRHVSPLLGRLGCNGRACHGSFQGQGGFQLSLFGYDFQKDHKAIRSRINVTKPDESLLLQKPTKVVEHEGGRRLTAESWQHRLLERWIAAGARIASTAQLKSLEVEPSEIVFARPGFSQPFRVTAHWQDGSVEDVTCLCRIESRDDSIAAVDASGHIKATGRGDTHIVVSYDNGVIALPVLIPTTDRTGDAYPQVTARTEVDRLVVAKLRRLGIVPSAVCSDEDFLRRVSIDLTGTLPTPSEVLAFLADDSADKRDRLIEQLLKSPAYAAWWANRLCDMTGNNPFRQQDGRIGHELARQWYAWIYRRVADNTPFDELVAGIVLATSRSDDQDYADYAKQMSSYLREEDPADFAKRPTMPHYWTRRTVEKPEDRALAFAHSFLGVRLQCAQCHKHPYDRWTQSDFQQFTKLFAAFDYGIRDSAKGDFERLLKSTGQPLNGNQRGQVTQEAAALAAEGRTVGWREFYFNEARSPHGTTDVLGTRVDIPRGSDPRTAVMQWMRERDNPYFARAFVNRVWANYFHVGLIDPVDDLNLANPPSNRPLLDHLSRGFVDSGYDMKWLHREITRSDTYQRDWRPNETNARDRRHYSRAIPRRLPAEVIYDALKQVTAADADLVQVRERLDRRAIGHLATRMAGTYTQRVFGQPERLVACDCERNNTPSLLQSIFLQNDPLIHARLADAGWLKQIATADSPDERQLIRDAYLRTVSRLPSEKEAKRAQEYLTESASITEGLRDLLWSLINSKEFILNH